MKDFKINLVGLSASPRESATEAVLKKALNAASTVDPCISTKFLTLHGKKYYLVMTANTVKRIKHGVF